MFTRGFSFAEIKIGNKLIIFGSVSKDSYKIELLQLLTIKKRFFNTATYNNPRDIKV